MQKAYFAGILALLLVCSAAHAEVKALWLFDEGEGDTVIDSSGNGCDGDIEGAKYVPGKYRTGLAFDGKSYVDFGYPPALQEEIVGPFTVETWIKLSDEPPSDHSTIIFMQTDGTLTIGFTSSTGGGFYGYAGSNIKITDPDVPFPVDEWVHIAHSFDGTIQKLYRNGEEIASQDASGATFSHPTTNPWTMGAWSTHDQLFLEDAIVDEMRISDEAVEPEELGFFNQFSPVEPAGKLTSTWASVKMVH